MNKETKKPGTLYIVATPIGNMADITLRAIETLKGVDTIACEDTRVSRKLLDHYDIRKQLIPLHQHSEEEKIDELVDQLIGGLDIAYITDGGTPAISDPGTFLVKKVQETNPKIQAPNNPQISNSKSQIECHSELGSESPRSRNKFGMTDHKIKAIPIPGPSAVAAAVSVSGMVEKEFYFAGFLPKKKGRMTKFNQLKTLDCPIVIYESANRIEKTLNDIKTYFGEEAEVFIAREMTKMFEEYFGGKILDVLSDLSNHKLKGELVLVVKKS